MFCIQNSGPGLNFRGHIPLFKPGAVGMGRVALVLVCFLLFQHLSASAQNVTFTVVTNPPAGGSITGGGIYPSGNSANIQVQASNGWYLEDVELPTGQPYNWHLVQFAGLINPNRDITLITNDSESITITSDMSLTATFGTLAPTFSQPPTGQILVAGSSLALNGLAIGRQPISYHWQFDGTNIVGASGTSLAVFNLQATNSGSYTLVASNAFGTTTSLVAQVTVEAIVLSVNGSAIIPSQGNPYSSYAPVTIAIQSMYPNGDIFYTLDGSAPDFNALPYTGSFVVPTSSTISAIAYSSDFSQSILSHPLFLNIIPTFQISTYAPGGGSIALNPNSNQYTNNQSVLVTAVPNPGWSFLNWSGGIAGTNPVSTLVINGNMEVEAQFGTPLLTSVSGSGAVLPHPAASLYPYGSSVMVSATPNPGSYFGLWGNAASGNQSPLSFIIYNASPTVSALFSAVPIGQASLTMLWQGGGITTESPSTNRIALGGTVVLTAYPNPGQQFLGWSGGASGSANPLSLVVNSNLVVTAQFSRVPGFSVIPGTGLPIQFEIDSSLGEICRLQTSANLSTWTTLFSVTNFYSYDPVYFLDSTSTNLSHQMYRVVSP